MAFLFLLWLCLSAVLDAKYRKCYNWLVIFGGILALSLRLISPESLPIEIGWIDSLAGLLIAFFVLIIFYKLRMMGAGDVKFAAILGLWIGWKLLLPIWVLSCLFALVHGLFARSSMKYFFAATATMKDGMGGGNKKVIPYVTYMSLATIMILMFYKN